MVRTPTLARGKVRGNLRLEGTMGGDIRRDRGKVLVNTGKGSGKDSKRTYSLKLVDVISTRDCASYERTISGVGS